MVRGPSSACADPGFRLKAPVVYAPHALKTAQVRFLPRPPAFARSGFGWAGHCMEQPLARHSQWFPPDRQLRLRHYTLRAQDFALPPFDIKAGAPNRIARFVRWWEMVR